MKKTIALSITLFVVMGAAGSALAAFDNNGTFFVAYEEDETKQQIGINDQPGFENFFDFGLTSDFITTPIGTSIDTNIGLADFNASAWDDVWVGIFGKTSLTGTQYYFSSDDPNAEFNALQFSGFDTGYNNLSQALTSGPNIQVDKAALTKTYKFEMQANGAEPGTYGGPVVAGTTFGAEVNLAGISAENAINLVIYGGDAFNDLIDPEGDFRGQLPSIFAANLSLDDDGSLLFTPVPVPAAVWLLGSGLLGLIGLRRRSARR